jgi:gas vesicle protein
MGLEILLKTELQKPNEQMKKQIQYILEELNSDIEPEEKVDEDFEDENYNDDDEEEVQDDEYVL